MKIERINNGFCTYCLETHEGVREIAKCEYYDAIILNAINAIIDYINEKDSQSS